MLAIGIPATMAAAVTLDLLARPGRWRSASAPGSSSRPTRAGGAARGSPCCGATASCVRLARREGFGPLLVRAAAGPSAPPTPIGVRLRRVLEEAGGVYVKLGQIAATRVDLVPPEICDELAGAAEPGRRPSRSSGSGRCSRPSSATRSSEVFAEFDGSRWPRRRSARPTAPGCTR